MYFTSTGVDLNFYEAAKWIRRGSELGYGVPVDHINAYMWYKAAVDRGERRAALALRSLSSLMSPVFSKNNGGRVAAQERFFASATRPVTFEHRDSNRNTS